MHPAFDAEFARYGFPYEGGSEFEWQIPVGKIDRFNQLTVNRTWIPWSRR